MLARKLDFLKFFQIQKTHVDGEGCIRPVLASRPMAQ